jgi:predicted secreted protein
MRLRAHGRSVRPVLLVVTALATLLASFGLAAPARGADPAKVAIIVGPVGEELAPTYIALADAAAAAAEERGATVAKAYSPDATADKVLTAVEDASIVVYFGHGIGTPNPYSDTPNPASITAGA